MVLNKRLWPSKVQNHAHDSPFRNALSNYHVFNLDAIRLIYNIKRTPKNAASLKMTHFSNIGVTEVFLEATPTTFISTFLLLSALFIEDDKSLRLVLFGDGLLSGRYKFGQNFYFTLFVL